MITRIHAEFDFCNSCRLHRQTHKDTDGKLRCIKCSDMRYLVDENFIVNSKGMWWVISFDGRSEIHAQFKSEGLQDAIDFIGTDHAIALVP